MSLLHAKKQFPTNLIQISRTITIENAEASKEADRIHILNSIAGSDDLEAHPPSRDPNFDEVNHAVRGAFAASVPALKAAAAAGGEEWKATLDCLSKGVMTGTFTVRFNDFPGLSSLQARELVSHVPMTCDGLEINGAEGEACEGAVDGMIEWMGKAKKVKKLRCEYCRVGNAEGGRDAGIRLPTALEASHHAETIEKLWIYGSDLVVSGNVSEWASALKKMTALKTLYLHHTDLSDEEKSILKNATHATDVSMLS